jgi:hypothetical protein
MSSAVRLLFRYGISDIRPKFEARDVSRVMQNRPKTDSARILNNVFRVRLDKVLINCRI